MTVHYQQNLVARDRSFQSQSSKRAEIKSKLLVSKYLKTKPAQ
jgi:hypothetical protein